MTGGSDTRAEAERLLRRFRRGVLLQLAKVGVCAAVAAGVVVIPGFWDGWSGLSDAGVATAGIMVLAALLWVTEAMPAFAVALLVVGLEIAVLGQPGGVYAAEGDRQAWRVFVDPWASPLIWLFLGGFVLARGCWKTGLDRRMAEFLLARSGASSGGVLAVVMGGTFLLSMFMSNTATAAMMMAVLAPLAVGTAPDDRRVRGLFLAVAVAANLGGMGTIIGSPPNAIAASQLDGAQRPDFLKWMLVGLPPALVLATVGFLWIKANYFKGGGGLNWKIASSPEESDRPAQPSDRAHRWLVAGVFAVTVLLWMTESLHGIPSPVVSFIPIIVFAVTQVLEGPDIRALPWDVLILLFGGMSLGVAVQETGVAGWMALQLPAQAHPGVAVLVFICSLLAVLLSNLMSNTATASILVPVAVGLVPAVSAAPMAVAVALCCSLAMCLPISTPPNAVAFGTGRVRTADLLGTGILLAVAGPLVVIPWVLWML